jgi:hypothetical protein
MQVTIHKARKYGAKRKKRWGDISPFLPFFPAPFLFAEFIFRLHAFPPASRFTFHASLQ